MKKKVVVIKSDSKRQGVLCEVNGKSAELMGAYIALTENLIEVFKKEGEYGFEILKTLKKDANELFCNAGIIEKDCDNDG